MNEAEKTSGNASATAGVDTAAATVTLSPKGDLTVSAISTSDFDGTDNFTTYHEYNKVLRTWFVAFGIAGPALFVVNEGLAKKLVLAGQLENVAILFLAGVTLQVLIAFVNKVANWYSYASCLDASLGENWKCKTSEWILSRFWIDVLVDILTITCFIWAGWKLLIVLGR